MSASLIRRGLELLSGDLGKGGGTQQKKGTKKNSNKRQRQQTPSSANVMELVSTKRQGVTKQVKRLQGRLGPGKSKTTVKNKRIKSAVEEFRKKQPKNRLRENLKYFLQATDKAEDSDTHKIQRHNAGRQSRSNPIREKKKKQEKPKEPQSLFTEEEFQQFQKEYFGRTVEKRK